MALACASCGSGAFDPLMLYPNERAKLYVGLTGARSRQVVTWEGSRGRSRGPREQDRLTLSAGIGLGPRAYVTLPQAVVGNRGDTGKLWGPADPSLAARGTLSFASAARVLQPQAQILAGIKPGWARASSAGSARRVDELDRFGDGSWQGQVGIDLWWPRLPVCVGLASIAVVSWPQRLATGQRSRAGTTLRNIVTLGRVFSRGSRWVVSLTYDRQAARLTSGDPVAESTRRQFNLATTLDLVLAAGWTLRSSVGRSAAFASFNAIEDINATLALIKAW